MATNQDSIISQSVLQTDVSETTSSTSSTTVGFGDFLEAAIDMEFQELSTKKRNWRWIATMKPREQVTEEEKKYIFSCGALTYLWEHGTQGYLRTISNKHCWTGCAVCNGKCNV